LSIEEENEKKLSQKVGGEKFIEKISSVKNYFS
jgi:hypothetical protein